MCSTNIGTPERNSEEEDSSRKMEYPTAGESSSGPRKGFQSADPLLFLNSGVSLRGAGRTDSQSVASRVSRAGGGFGTKTRARPVIGRGK